jgi:hypothetical protein
VPGRDKARNSAPAGIAFTSENAMRNRAIAVVAAFALAWAMGASLAADQKVCGGDNKLVTDSGLVRLATDLGSDSWWGLVYQGLTDAGYVTPQQKLDFLNNLFGTSLQTLDAMAAYEISTAASWDENGNSLVCVANIRGTRTSYGDPNFANYFFFIWDDKEFQNPH